MMMKSVGETMVISIVNPKCPTQVLNPNEVKKKKKKQKRIAEEYTELLNKLKESRSE